MLNLNISYYDFIFYPIFLEMIAYFHLMECKNFHYSSINYV